MIGAKKILAQRTLATLIELRTQPPNDVAYPMMVLGFAMSPQIGITYVDSVAADKRAAAYRTIASLIVRLIVAHVPSNGNCRPLGIPERASFYTTSESTKG